MQYFSQDDHNAVLAVQSPSSHHAPELERIHNRLHELHRKLYGKMRQRRIDLHPNPASTSAITHSTSTTPFAVETLTLTYMRSRPEAEHVESMMGRDSLHRVDDIKPEHHPNIELRLTPDHFAIELVISPYAWYDQQNFAGKMTVATHRNYFFKMLRYSTTPYVLGFWTGVHQGAMNLNTEQMPPRDVFFEYMDTFAARRDWLRLGRWYEPDDPALDESSILEEAFNQIRELFGFYQFILWKNDNNFQSFYKKITSQI